MADANVALLPIAIVAVTALEVEFAAVIDVTRLTIVPADGVNPVKAVVPSYVHDVVAVAAEEGMT